MKFEKIDAPLLRVWRDREDPLLLRRHVARWGVLLPDAGHDEPRVVGLARLSPGADLAVLTSMPGVRLSTGEFGGVRHLVLPLSALEDFVAHDDVLQVSLSPRRRR